jgi:hypothetical protein
MRESSKIEPAAATRWWLFPLLMGVGLALVIATAQVQKLLHTPSVLVTLRYHWLVGAASSDSWMPMRAAFTWLSGPHQGGVYQEIFFNQHIKFQYPPSSLLLFAVPHMAGLDLTDRLLNRIGWVMILVEAAAVGAMMYVALQKTPLRTRLAAALLAAAMTLFFYPVLRGYSLGQVQAWINTAFAIAALCWLTGRPGVAGLFIGAACLAKPQLGLFLLWGLLRRQWRFSAALAAVAAAGVLLSILWFGLLNQFDYLSALKLMGQRGEAFYFNQSVNGLAHRFLGTADPLIFPHHAFPDFNPVVYGATLATSALMLVACLWLGRGGVGDFLIAGLTFTMASPIAWDHHYGVLPPMLAMLAASLVARPARAEALVLLAAYVVAASRFQPQDHIPPGLGSLPISALFFAALTTLVLLYRRQAAVSALAPAAALSPEALAAAPIAAVSVQRLASGERAAK